MMTGVLMNFMPRHAKQVLGGTMLQSANGGDGTDDVKVSYENLRDVKSIIEQFERLLVM